MTLTPDEIALYRTDLLAYSQFMFRRRRGMDFLPADHHKTVCDALEQVVIGNTTRLIINIPPRAGKTELAVKNFISWCMGNFPDSEFIHASYAKELATANVSETRNIMQHEAWSEVFGQPEFRGDSNAKDFFKTNQGGAVMAVGVGGGVTGFGAGKMRPTFGGCFPEWQEVSTPDGNKRIADIAPGDFVYTMDKSSGMRVNRAVLKSWTNPANDIIRIHMSDGSFLDCTPDHEILTESGWVAAIHLANALNLVNTEAGYSGGIRSADGAVEGDFDDAFRVLWLCIPDRIRKALRDGRPCLSRFDLPNNSNSNPIAGGDIGAAIRALEYFNSILSGQLCARSAFEEWERSMPDGVLHVVGLSAVREIVKPVVGGVPVEVPDLIPIGAFTYKLLCDNMRDVFERDLSTHGKVDPHVSISVTRGFKHSDGACPANLSKVRNLVKPIGSPDSFPIGVSYVGHVDKTFCLSVDVEHSFQLSHTGAIVSNCIIVDDPHKPAEANSDAVRKSTLAWFQNTLESRKNSNETPIIVIMQRLHEEDLAGWLADGGNGEEWTVIKIPAIRDNGESFWEENSNFAIEKLRRQEQSNAYVFAGQYMQIPSPLGGGILKDAWYQYWDILPPLKWRKIYADTAQKTKEQNDFSVFQCWGDDGTGRKYLIDQVRGKWEAPELLSIARAFWQKHLKEDKAKLGQLRAMMVEDKSSGTGLIQTLERERVPVIGVKRNIDKITRAMDAAPLMQTGCVFLPRKEANLWVNDLLAESSAFPNGKHDDQLDPMFDAVVDRQTGFNLAAVG